MLCSWPREESLIMLFNLLFEKRQKKTHVRETVFMQCNATQYKLSTENEHDKKSIEVPTRK